MRILLTGGAGFIGSHVADAYIASGHQVAIVDNLSTGKKANLNPGATFYKADIHDAKAIDKIFSEVKPQVVNHHAALVSVTESVKNPLSTYETNVTGTINLLRQPGVQRFIFASTGGAMYANPKKFPASEHETPTPLSPYGISKLLAEVAIKHYGEVNGFESVILRYANVFGPRQYPKGESGVIAIFSELAKTGTQPTIYKKDATRDYVYVGDVAKANVLALSHGKGIYNIGTGKEVDNQKVFETVSQVFNWRVIPRYEGPRPGDVARSALDAGKAHAELGWASEVDLLSGVKKIHDFKA